MKKQISVKIPVGGRIYPLTIAMEEEESIRKAAKEIDDSIKKLRSTYAVRDTQDLLAMTALQAVSELKNDTSDNELNQCIESLKQIESQLDNLLN
jgi:cell division protein ZapA (FtsZ GTPase activity inhibitor)